MFILTAATGGSAAMHYMRAMLVKSFSATVAERFEFLIPQRYRVRHPVVPVVRLSGAIGAVMPLRAGLSMSNVASLLERAFAIPHARAVALVINSPGGSAAQSHLIFRRIRALAEEKNLPVLAFVEDAAASGGYMIACAADEIFADAASIVGSIGVVSAGFGFDRFIARFGIERRVHTAGENKAMLDPFQPEDPKDVERLKGLQRSIHEVFEGLVRERRGGKLQPNDDLFTGAFWVGQEAVGLGLIDGLGDIRSVMRSRFGDKVQLRLIEPARPALLSRLMGRRPIGQSSLLDPAEILGAVEERSAWSRLGL
jgi:signal peptide peptidase SppA